MAIPSFPSSYGAFFSHIVSMSTQRFTKLISSRIPRRKTLTSADDCAGLFERLPEEIIEQIFSFVKQEHLLPLAQTCSLLRPYAQAAIFQRVALHDEDSSPHARKLQEVRGLRVETVFALFSVVVQRQSTLAHCVRSLTIMFQYETSWKDVRELILLLPNLQRLALQPLKGLTGEQLYPESETRIKEFCGHDLPIGHELIEFLERQPNFSSWSISGKIHREADVPASLLARITHQKIRFKEDTIPILHGLTNLTHLNLTVPMQFRMDDTLLCQALAHCGTKLVSLVMQWQPIPWVFEKIPPLTPNLRFLDVRFLAAPIPFSRPEDTHQFKATSFPASLETFVCACIDFPDVSAKSIPVDGISYCLGTDQGEKVDFKPSVVGPAYVAYFGEFMPVKRVVYWESSYMHSFRRQNTGSSEVWIEDPEPAFDITCDTWKDI